VGGTRERARKPALPAIRRSEERKNAMTREQWMWTRASIALVAAAAATIKNASRIGAPAEDMPAAPQPIAAQW